MNKIDLICKMYLSDMSIPEISETVDMSKSTIRRRLKARGILRSVSDGIRLAAKKGKLGSGMRGKKVVFTMEHRENIRQSRLRHGEKFAAGLSLKPSGYVEITRGLNKGRSQHVVVMEEYLGRRLLRGEVVHHKNKIKNDNRLDNLKLMTNSKHLSLHASERTPIRDERGRFLGWTA